MGVAVFTSLRGYRRSWLRGDLVAGLTVWAVLIPESLAYATIAGVPPVVGLYAAVPALVLYAAVGSSRHLVVGPMSGTAALSASIVATVATSADQAVSATAALALVVGVLAVVAGLLRFGFLSAFISEPVLKGFIIGLALTIIVGQVPKLLGIDGGDGNFFEKTWHVLSHLGSTDGLTIVVGIGAMAMILVLRRWLPLVPGSLLVVLIGIAAVWAFDLDDHGLSIVGDIQPGLPDVAIPDPGGWSVYLDLVGPAVGLLLVGFAEGLGAAKTYATAQGYEIDTNRELAGLGAANIGSAFAAGMVVNGSLSKTAVNGSAGARTQVSGLTTAALTVVTLLALTGLFEQLPEAVLAAVVICAVIDLVDIASVRALYRVWSGPLGRIYKHAARSDFIAAIAALIGVLVFDTLPGLFIGIAVSLLTLLYRSSRPYVATLVKDPQSSQWVDQRRYPRLDPEPDVLVVRVEGGLFFANADFVRTALRQHVSGSTRAVVLDGETTPFVDVTGSKALAELRDELRRDGVTLLLAKDIGQVRDVFETSGTVPDEQTLFSSVDDAIRSVRSSDDSG
ncbi:MAG: SulP family inorganic anion transporter [Aeromicrobium sp.]